MLTTTTIRVLVVLTLSLPLAGCGTGGDSSAASEPGATTARSEAVTIADMAFEPTEIEVPTGTQVTWTNDDDVPHTVTFDDDGVADSDELAAGDTFSATFDQAGTFDYVCALHPDMKATVTAS